MIVTTGGSPFGPVQDDLFMKKALLYAQKAYRSDEVPIGAVIVDAQGTILAAGSNQVMKKKSQLVHAEMEALRRASKRQGDWRLEGCWLYATLEPCAMCINAITMSRLAGIVFGATSPLFGYTQWMYLDNQQSVPLYRCDTLQVKAGVYEQECSDLLKNYFQKKRKNARG